MQPLENRPLATTFERPAKDQPQWSHPAMHPLASRRSTEKAVAKPRPRKVSQFRTELSLAGLLTYQELTPPPAGVGRVHRLGDEDDQKQGAKGRASLIGL